MPVYTLPDLPYDYAALAPVISPEIIELHHDKHHAAYVKGANDTLEQLAEARDKEQWGSVNGLEPRGRIAVVRGVSRTAFQGCEGLHPQGRVHLNVVGRLAELCAEVAD